MIRMLVLALALSVGAAAAHAEEGDDKAKEAAPDQAKIQILDPTAHNLVRLEPLMLGSDNDSTHMAPKEYRLKSGQGYRWKIKASDQTEYALVAPALFRNIWIRRLGSQ